MLRLLIRGDFAPRLDMIAVTKVLRLSSLLFRVEEYIKEGRDQNIVHSDPDSVYSKRFDKTKDNSGISATQARFRHRSTHVPNLIELGSTLERH